MTGNLTSSSSASPTASATTSAENVQKVHALGQEYNVWTVNEAADGAALVEMGVDYITTNILEGTVKAE